MITRDSILEENLLPLERIIDLLKQQNNVFEAVAEIRNINSLNGYTVIDEYTERQIKQHYKHMRNYVNVEDNTCVIVNGNACDNVVYTTKTHYNPYRELQKGYMKLNCI